MRSTEILLKHYNDRLVIPNDVYDLRAIGPERYTDYVVMSTQLEARLQMILNTLPEITELSTQ